jgi:hypothetical protein
MKLTLSSQLSDRLKTLPQGHHLCLFYEHRAEQIAIVVEYLLHGLRRGEQCLFVSEARNLAEVHECLGGLIDTHTESARGALQLLTESDTYLQGGCFDAERMIAMLNTAVQQAIRAGFRGLRAVGDMSWMLGAAPGSDQAILYEAMITPFLARSPAVGLCLYDRTRLESSVLEGALHTHPHVLTGVLCCDANPFFEQPLAFLQHFDPRERFASKLRSIATRHTSPPSALPSKGT